MDTRPPMTLDTRQGRRALLASVRASRDPFAPMNLGYAKLVAGFLWTAGALVALAMAPLAPPTVALGTAGWAVAAVLAAVGAFIAIRRFDSARSATPYEMLVTGFVAVAIIATLEWLAGGRSSPYHELFVLPVVFAVAVHSRRRAILFFLWLALAIALPAFYGRVNGSQADDMVAQLGMLLALGVVARALIIMVRAQRSALGAALGDAESRARRDLLTGLGNRRAFDETLAGEIARAERSGSPLSLLIADINDFKSINDRAGHLAGDESLRRVAEALLQGARRADLCFRWGGDEFAVLLPGAGFGAAQDIRQRLCGLLDEGPDAAGPLVLTCGTAEWQPGQGARALLAAADEALLRGKRAGRFARSVSY